jgi:hypothetical protein
MLRQAVSGMALTPNFYAPSTAHAGSGCKALTFNGVSTFSQIPLYVNKFNGSEKDKKKPDPRVRQV